MVVAAAGIATISPGYLFYPEQAFGTTSAAQTLTLQNTGTTSMNLTSQALAGNDATDFAIVADSCGTTLAVNAICAVQVEFIPSSYGGYGATVNFVDGPGTQKIPVAGSVADSYSTTVTAQAPTGYWRMDPPASPVPAMVGDASGNGDTATVQTGGGTAPTFGESGPETCTPAETAVKLATGGTAYFSTATSITNPQDFTLEAWFHTSSATGGALISFGNTATGTPTIFDRALYVGTDGLLYWAVSDGATIADLVSSQPVDDNTWHLAVATISGAGMSLYVDGALVASNVLTPDDDYAGYWRLGAMATSGFTNAGTGYFAGTMGEVAVIGGAVSEATVAQQWAASSNCELALSGPAAIGWSASLTGINQSLDDAAGTVVADTLYFGPGWNITVSASSLVSGTNSLPAVSSGYEVNGSATSSSATTVPSKACTGTGSVAPSGNSVKYPLTLSTSPQLLYTAAIDSGEGTCTLGTNWWLAVPANSYAGTYLGTVTLTLASGP
jgi:hypothetical protein